MALIPNEDQEDSVKQSPIPHSLVDSGIVLPLSGETEHATDDSAVVLGPLHITDLLPLPPVLHLHVALRHWDALAV